MVTKEDPATKIVSNSLQCTFTAKGVGSHAYSSERLCAYFGELPIRSVQCGVLKIFCQSSLLCPM